MDGLGKRDLMGITQEGIAGEQMLGELLKEKGYKIFQPDWVGFKDGQYYLFECKHQERFTPPPFEGHGLPAWQVKARLEFQRQTGIVATLVVFDKKTDEIFWQRLDELENHEHCKDMFDTDGEILNTSGLKPRRIYKLNLFKKL